jgi:hypothetical protein
MPTAWERTLIFALFAGLLGFAVAAFAPQIFHDGDSWWHLAAGGWMLDHHAVLKRDMFSFTFAGQPWDAQEWLAEIVMALVFRVGGWSGLHILFGLALAATAAIVAAGVRARIAALPALLISLVGLACLSGSLLARPHLLALPLLAAWTLEMMNARKQQRAPGWWLVPVMLLWANLHGSFALGLALAAAFALEDVIETHGPWKGGALFVTAAVATAALQLDVLAVERKAWKGWWLFLILSVIAALVTPQFINGLLFPFQLLLLGSIQNIGEWAPTSFFPLTPFPVALAGLFYLGATGKLKLPLLRALIVIGLATLALAHVRHQMLFGIVVPLLLADALAQKHPAPATPLPRWLAPLGAGLFVLMIVVRIFLPTMRGDDRVSPMTALASLPTALKAQPVLNAYDFGGYLIFAGVKPYVDGRTDMYGDAFLANYDLIMSPDRKAMSDTLARWHIAWTILPPSPGAQMMDSLPGWHRFYSDAYAVVDVRN